MTDGYSRQEILEALDAEAGWTAAAAAQSTVRDLQSRMQSQFRSAQMNRPRIYAFTQIALILAGNEGQLAGSVLEKIREIVVGANAEIHRIEAQQNQEAVDQANAALRGRAVNA